MGPVTGVTIRGDINSFVEEAAGMERFLIGAQILPPFGVEVKSGTYPKLKKGTGELLKPGSTVREAGASYGQMHRLWDVDTYDCIDRGLEEAVDDAQRKDNARFFDNEAVSARLVLRAVMLDHEIRVQGLIQNNATFPGTNSLVAYTAANIATINFPGDVLAAIERVNDLGEVADTIVMSSNVFNRLGMSTLFQNFIRGNRPTDSTISITAQGIQSAFADAGITNVLIGRARYDSAKKGQAYAAAKIWNDTYVWVGKVQSGDFKMGGAGRTLVWNAEGGLWVTETYRDERIRSTLVRVRQNTCEKIVNADAGTMITTQYA